MCATVNTDLKYSMKHSRCFCYGLNMCLSFIYYPQLYSCHFFQIVNLDIFWLGYAITIFIQGVPCVRNYSYNIFNASALVMV